MSVENCFGGFAGSKSAPAAMGGWITFFAANIPASAPISREPRDRGEMQTAQNCDAPAAVRTPRHHKSRRPDTWGPGAPSNDLPEPARVRRAVGPASSYPHRRSLARLNRAWVRGSSADETDSPTHPQSLCRGWALCQSEYTKNPVLEATLSKPDRALV